MKLPQLVDIWAGNMSIVGPRPERVEHVAKYTQDIPEFGYRLKVKGGLTGYAQVYADTIQHLTISLRWILYML